MLLLVQIIVRLNYVSVSIVYINIVDSIFRNSLKNQSFVKRLSEIYGNRFR